VPDGDSGAFCLRAWGVQLLVLFNFIPDGELYDLNFAPQESVSADWRVCSVGVSEWRRTGWMMQRFLVAMLCSLASLACSLH